MRPVDVGGMSYSAPGVPTNNPYSPPTGPGAPATPPGPQVSQGAPLPNPAVYGAQQATANQAYENAKNSIRTKRLTSLQKYGFLADVDPVTGNMTNVHVDPNNQFGGYQQMLRGQASTSDDLLYQEHGRGFTGGLVNADQGNLEYNQGLQGNQFGKAMQGEMSDYDQSLLEAGISHDTALNQIAWQQAQDAIQNQLFTPVDYSTPTTPSPTTTSIKTATAPKSVQTTAKKTAAKQLASYVVKSTKRKR